MIIATSGWPDLELLQAAPILIWRAGLDGLCDWFNSAWLTYTGRTMSQEVGDGWVEGVHPDDLDRCTGIYRKAFACRQPFEMEYRLMRACGQYGWIVDYGIPIFAWPGSFLGYVGYCFDVTARRESEEQLDVFCRNLERSNDELEQFAYAVSHDLREPLRMVISFASLIRQRYGDCLDDVGQEFLGYVHDGARRMDEMIRDLLAYSRIERCGDSLAPVRIGDSITYALENLTQAIADCRAAIVVDLDPALRVRGDGHQIARLFQNLIGNAIKYRRPEASPRVRLGAVELDDGRVVFSVEDNGIGIDPKFADQVFLLFQRLHTQADYDGTGVGLAICRKIVERHGGRIWVDPAPSGGSVFRFDLAGVPGTEAGETSTADGADVAVSSVPKRDGKGRT